MKKYLNTFEDIEALRNTDTKIYSSGSDCYFQFIKGVPCVFYSDGVVFYNSAICLDETKYIEVPDEPDESWVGKLGWFWDYNEEFKSLDVLERIETGRYGVKDSSWSYDHFRPLTPEEVEKYTGYKVVKED
jgi:hypothetical protein